jgi:hypothetical protein
LVYSGHICGVRHKPAAAASSCQISGVGNICRHLAPARFLGRRSRFGADGRESDTRSSTVLRQPATTGVGRGRRKAWLRHAARRPSWVKRLVGMASRSPAIASGRLRAQATSSDWAAPFPTLGTTSVGLEQSVTAPGATHCPACAYGSPVDSGAPNEDGNLPQPGRPSLLELLAVDRSGLVRRGASSPKPVCNFAFGRSSAPFVWASVQ